jgi:hypothetical protein
LKLAEIGEFRIKRGDIMGRQTAYNEEYKRWSELFASTDEAIQKAAAGLIEKAAYIHGLCAELQEVISKSGAIKVHPHHPDIQKPVPAVKELARLTEAYANIVNKLNALRAKNVIDDDDELAEFV